MCCHDAAVRQMLRKTLIGIYVHIYVVLFHLVHHSDVDSHLKSIYGTMYQDTTQV